ncbi:hypothetical protein SNEBB_007606 [Seison nebaliae]|nr:hypothetical protein SNEBB_007606 [Seison nebaliae]
MNTPTNSNGKKLYECTICGIVLQNPKSFNIQRHLSSRKCKKNFGSLTDTEKLELQKGKSEDLEVDRSISRFYAYSKLTNQNEIEQDGLILIFCFK